MATPKVIIGNDLYLSKFTGMLDSISLFAIIVTSTLFSKGDHNAVPIKPCRPLASTHKIVNMFFRESLIPNDLGPKP